MAFQNTEINFNASPQERFKQMLEEAISNALWDFGLRKNEFDYKQNGFRKKAIQKDGFWHYEAKADFLGHEKIILDTIKLLPRKTEELESPTGFLIEGNTISGLEKPEKIEALVQICFENYRKFIEKERQKTTCGQLIRLKGVNKLDDPENNCNTKTIWDMWKEIYASPTNAHKISSIPQNAYDVMEGHLKDAIRKYFGVEVQACYIEQPTEKFTATIDEEAAKEKYQSEKKALESSKSHHFHRLTAFGMVAAEDFRAAAQEIAEWQSKRIADLPASIRHTIAICDSMRDYKALSPDERAQVSTQMVREIGKLQKTIKQDVQTLSHDCETTDHAVEILASHRQNMKKYANGFTNAEKRLKDLFGSAAVDEKTIELQQIVANTGIQVAQQTAIHQSYNTANLRHISKLSGKMDALSGSVMRLSIAIKLRDMLKDGGVVGDIAKETLNNIGLHKKNMCDFQSMNLDDLDNIIEGEATHLQKEIVPIADAALKTETLMIEGKPAGQLYLPSPDSISDEEPIIS